MTTKLSNTNNKPALRTVKISDISLRSTLWNYDTYVQLFLILWKPLLLEFISILCSRFCSQLADEWGNLLPRHPTHEEISDVVISYVGLPLLHWSFLPDVIVLPMVLWTFLCLLIDDPKSTKVKNKLNYLKNVARRFTLFLYAHALLLLMRCTTNIATVSMNSARCASQIPGGLFFNHDCHDLIFSGHSMTSFICTCFCMASAAPVIVKIPILIQGAFGGLVNILDGDHYSVDVLIALYVSILVWKVLNTSLQATYQSASNKNE